MGAGSPKLPHYGRFNAVCKTCPRKGVDTCGQLTLTNLAALFVLRGSCWVCPVPRVTGLNSCTYQESPASFVISKPSLQDLRADGESNSEAMSSPALNRQKKCSWLQQQLNTNREPHGQFIAVSGLGGVLLIRDRMYQLCQRNRAIQDKFKQFGNYSD